MRSRDSINVFMVLFRLLSSVFLVVLIWIPQPADAITKVIYPVNGAAVKTATMDVLGMTTTPEKTVILTLNGSRISVKPGDDGSFTQAVRLQKWWNRLDVDGTAMKVFFLPPGGKLPDNAVERYTHPAIMDGCSDCHEFTRQGGVELAEEGKELCLMCHDDPTQDKKNKPLPVVHSPIADDDDCLSCHDPHQGINDTLNPEPVPELCYQCHESVTEKSPGRKYSNIHVPVGEGSCTECHNPHASRYGKLLSGKVNEVCLECHDDPSVDSRGKKWSSSHPPVEDSCVNCHSPHASDVRSNLLDEVFELCSGCHNNHPAHSLDASKHLDNETGGIVSLPPDFPVTFEGMMVCTGCHLPHGSRNSRLLKVPKGQLCSTCHQL